MRMLKAMQSDLPLALHYLPTETCIKPASILQIGHMWHKANNAMLRGLRFKPSNLPGDVTTLPNAFRRLLGHPTHCPFAPCRKKIIFCCTARKTFCPASREKPFEPLPEWPWITPHACILSRRPCQRPAPCAPAG